MLLRLSFSNWDTVRFAFTDDRKDCDSFDTKEGLLVFVYGYPFKEDHWVSAQEIAGLCSEGGFGFVHDIDGVYSIVVLDRIKRQCFVIVDRYGVYTLFYTQSDDSVLISDSVRELVRNMPRVTLSETRVQAVRVSMRSQAGVKRAR